VAHQSPLQKLDVLLTRVEVADLLQIKPQTLAKWASTNRYELRFLKIGSRVRYRLADVLAFQSQNMHGAPGALSGEVA
jgi:hypothetical protein